MLLKRLAVIIFPLIIFAGLELLFYDIRIIYALLAVSTVLLFVFLKVLIKAPFTSREFWVLIILPFLLYYLTIIFLLLIDIDSALLKQTVIVFFAMLLWLYFENIFLFYYRPSQYQKNSIENLSSLLNLLAFFAAIINLNSLSVFLSLPVWFLSIILIVIVSLLLLQSFWINRIKHSFRFIYLIIINIIILEFFAALSFLPTNFYISSIILTIFYYLLWGVFKMQLLEELSKKIFLRYLLISTILIFIIIITASWV